MHWGEGRWEDRNEEFAGGLAGNNMSIHNSFKNFLVRRKGRWKRNWRVGKELLLLLF